MFCSEREWKASGTSVCTVPRISFQLAFRSSRLRSSGWEFFSCFCFRLVFARSVLGRLQFRSAGLRDIIWRGGLVGALCAEGTDLAHSLARDNRYMLRRAGRGKYAPPHNGAQVMAWEALFLLLIVVAGTSGELCVTRAMKTIGEVKDFRPVALVRVDGHCVFRVVGRALSRKRQLRGSGDSAQLRGWRVRRRNLSRREGFTAALGRGAACLRGCDARFYWRKVMRAASWL